MRGVAWSDTNHDFNAYNSAGQIWNGSAYVTEDVADYLTYRIAATKTSNANSASLQAVFIADAPAGTAYYLMRVRGASLADSYVVWVGDDSQDNDLAAIKAKTDLIGSGALLISAPVSGDGDLLELILETDYLAANGRALEWTFDEITGITTSATGKFGLKDALTGTEVYVNTTGTVTDLGSGTFKVSFNITNTALNALSPGKYDWSVEVLEGSYKITVARNRQIKTRVDIVEKQT